MTNYVTKLIGFLLIPAAIFVINSPIQAEAGEKFEMRSSLVTPLDIRAVWFDFEKGKMKFKVDGDAFKSTVKFNKLTGNLLFDSAGDLLEKVTMSLVLDCRVSRLISGEPEPIDRFFTVSVPIPLDAAIKGENLKHKDNGSLSDLASELGLDGSIENGDVLEVLSVRIDLIEEIDDMMMMITTTVAVPGFQADLSKDDDGNGNDEDDSMN